MIADNRIYLKQEKEELLKVWPDNHTMNIVCHGHSIPCGYTVNHVVRMLDAYPHLLHKKLTKRFPTAVMNIIVSGIGGESSIGGAKRFKEDVLCYKPDILTIDYGRNDMFHTIKKVELSWRNMIEEALKSKTKIILITPAPDCGEIYYDVKNRKSSDEELITLIIKLAQEYEIGLADIANTFKRNLSSGQALSDYMISENHLNKEGHVIIANEIMKWFPLC